MKTRSSISSNQGWLVPAILIFGLIWTAVLALARITIHSPELTWLGAAGALSSAVLIAVVERQQARLRNLAETDPLTGLTNHRGFHEVLGRELAGARRAGTSLALVSLDLDDFKTVNDTHGHPYGDGVLRQVGAELRGAVRGSDTAARVGGEEFALILPETSGEMAREIAERARDAISRVPALGPQLSCSAGIAIYPVDADDAATLIELADGSLYWAKESGKSRTRRFDPEHVTLADSKHQASEIRRILVWEDLLEAVYQPVMALTTGRIVGYEALARFPHSPERPPAAWFAQAHACGLGAELEAAAIRAALKPLGRRPDAHLAVNVSPAALASDPVRNALPDNLSDLVIELTEHDAYVGDEALAAALQDLRDRGARIAIDDAGAGYAGLKQVMWVRPDIVKLDRDLIRAIHTDPARMALVESFVRFARRVGATVCAEGIETFDDLAALANLDVPWGQGYALGRPAPPWPDIAPGAAETCHEALEQALISSPGGESSMVSAGDRRLEHVSAKLANARTRTDLYNALGLIAGELHADKIALSQWHRTTNRLETLAESGDQSPDEFFGIEDYPLTEAVVSEQKAVQVLVGDPDADPAETELLLTLGYRSLLMVPVVHRGESVGLLEAHSKQERPWTRTEINRARIIANQFASVIQAFVMTPERSPGQSRT